MTDPADDGIYELADEPPMRVVPIPVVEDPLLPKALEYRTPTAEPPRKADVEELKRFRIPFVLLVGGAVIDLLSTAFWSHHPLRSMVEVLSNLVLGTAFMLAGVFLTSKVRHLEIGDFRSAVLRLAAISVAPAATADLINPLSRFVPPIILIGWIVQFLLYFALLGALFDLDEADTWICIFIILIVRMGVWGAWVGIAHLMS